MRPRGWPLANPHAMLLGVREGPSVSLQERLHTWPSFTEGKKRNPQTEALYTPGGREKFA